MPELPWELILDDNLIEEWPNCATPDCPNKCCRIMNSIYCSPCNCWKLNIPMSEWRKRIEAKRKELSPGKLCLCKKYQAR